MTLELQYKINSNQQYLRYIRMNSYWYKHLNRNPLLFKEFVDKMKEEYKLRPTDRFNSTLEKIQLVQSFLSLLK